MRTVYDEWYGELSVAQRAAYRKHNVSPSDHDMLIERFGAGAHQEITAFVRAHGRNVLHALLVGAS